MKGVDPKTVIIALGKTLSHEREAAHELWAWLPSYDTTRAAHSQHADTYLPQVEPPAGDVMREAAKLLAVLFGHNATRHEVSEWFGCLCGDPLHSDADAIVARLREKWGNPLEDLTLKNTGAVLGRGESYDD
jgi:hypothetical protein